MNNTHVAPASVSGCRIALVLAILLLGVTPGALAQDMSWEPESMFFENTPIGTTETRTLTLTNIDKAVPMGIDGFEWDYNHMGTYAYEPDRPIPTILLPGESVEIDIRFTPVEAFTFASAILNVTNTSANASPLLYWLDGMGVEADPCSPFTDCSGTCIDLQNDVNNCGSCGNACPTPANASATCESANCSFVCNAGYEPLGDECIPSGASIVGLTNLLINYWFAALEEPPTIVGFGPGESAVHRRDAIENMLLNAREYVFTGVYDHACGLLRSAYLKMDGGYPFVLPPDFVAGEGVAGLAERVEAVIEELDGLMPDGCPLPEPKTKP